MSLTHKRVFRVRYYECDANGHLNNANYLRYMQETAFDATAAAGYSAERYHEFGGTWLARASQIEFLLPLKYNDQIQVKTWLADFQRVSCRRLYEFNIPGTGELAARAYTDWAYIDTQNGKPARIPEEMISAFFPEGVPREFPKRERIPEQPAPPEDIFNMRRPVEWSDLDQMRHVNNAKYLNYITECGMQVIEAFGWPWERMKELGFAIFIRRIQIQYLQPAQPDDVLEIGTWASNIRRSTADRHYTIRRVSDGSLLAKSNAFSVWVDLKANRPIRIPEVLLEDFSPNIL